MSILGFPNLGRLPSCCGRLLHTFVANALCSYAPQRNLVKGVCCRPSESVTSLRRGTAAQACYKPNVLIHSHLIPHNFLKPQPLNNMVVNVIPQDLESMDISFFIIPWRFYYKRMKSTLTIRATTVDGENLAPP